MNTLELTEASRKHEGCVEGRISKHFDNLASLSRLLHPCH